MESLWLKQERDSLEVLEEAYDATGYQAAWQCSKAAAYLLQGLREEFLAHRQVFHEARGLYLYRQARGSYIFGAPFSPLIFCTRVISPR